MSNTNEFKIYSVKDYTKANDDFIEKQGIVFQDIKSLCKELENDKSYHFRIHKKINYIFFGDIDGYSGVITEFINRLQKFLKENYKLTFDEEEFLYTENESKHGSYHYSIPKWNLSSEKLKEIHAKFKETFDNKNVIDTTIYSEHWFRCPNQSKGHIGDKTHHIIKSGKMRDFVIDYIPKKSENIENCTFIKEIDKIEEIKEILPKKIEINGEDEKIEFTYEDLNELTEMLTPDRCNNYGDWLNVGMCLHNIDSSTIHIWRKWSENSSKYEKGISEQKWKSFKKNKDGLKIGSLLMWCKRDNEKKYNDFIHKRKVNSIIGSKFPNKNLILGELVNVTDLYSYMNLKNTECLIKNGVHADFPTSMYLEITDKLATVKCRHPECFGKILCNHVQLTKQEVNIVFNGNVTININNNNDDDLVEFQQINIYEDKELNKLVYDSLTVGEACNFAEIIYRKYKDVYNYGENDDWYIFKNHRWKNIKKKNVNLRYDIIPLLNEIYSKLLDYYKQNDNDKKKISAIKKIIKNFSNTIFKNNIMAELCDIFLINNNPERDFVKNLDKNNFLIGFNNGVYDLKTFEFRDGKPEDLLTMSVRYDYNDNHTDKYNDLLTFLNDIQPNKEDRDYMLTYLSIGLVGNLLELFTILTGTGRNGKSKLIELLAQTFGDYSGSVQSTLFTRPRPDANSPDPGLLNLLNKKLLTSSEPEKGSKLNTGFIKFITGKDITTLRNCHSNDMFDFKANFITLFSCNDIPECDDIDKAFSDRLRCIDFPNKFTDNPTEKNHKLINKEINENFCFWRQDFMLLLIEHYKKYKETNILHVTKSISKWTNKYQENTDVYLSFLIEKTKESDEYILNTELYEYFKEWFRNNNPNTKIPKNRDFITGIKKHKLVEQIQVNKERFYGIRNLEIK